MLIVYLAFSLSYSNPHSLHMPFIHTEIGEIGEWTLRGQAVSQKRVIHLTSGVSNVSGGICLRIPVDSKGWVSDLEFSLDGDEMVISYSKYVCPDVQSFYSGLKISLKSLKNGSIYAVASGEEIFNQHEYLINKKFDKINLRLVKSPERVSVIMVMSGSEMVELFNIHIPSVYEIGYFSIHSYSPSSCDNCFTNIYSFNYFATESKIEIAPNTSEKSRKFLKSTASSRSMQKMMRRSKMLVISQYIEEFLSENNNLNGNPSELSDSFKEITESLMRGKEIISAQDLSNLIQTKIKPVLEKASSRFERVSESLWQTKFEMNSLWDNAKSQLKQINGELNAEFRLFEKKAIEIAQSIKSTNDNRNEIGQPEHRGNYLFNICIFEFLGYIVFFVTQRKRIAGKKAK